jgi:adenine-specific DNA methylase
MTGRPRLLIEDWLPVRKLGIESRRERAVVTTLPPINWLHVWWARRPLAASAGVVLAGLLPTWSPELAAAFPDAKQVQTADRYHSWLLQLIGIWGDPVTARAEIDRANARGYKLKGNPYGYKQAYRNSPSEADLDLLHSVLRHTWNGDLPLLADPTAGGGSIPFVSARLSIPTYANDLNAIAAAVIRAGVEIPARYGRDLLPHLEKWGKLLTDRVQARLKQYFPLEPGESVIAYTWARTVACPRTGRVVPLVTDWWLRRDGGKEVAVRLVTESGGIALHEPHFKIVRGHELAGWDPSEGVMSGGSAVSPYDHLAIDGSYIKCEAQAGRMSQILYAIAVRKPDGKRDFRAPSQRDLEALDAAAKELARLRPGWEADGLLPTEAIDSVSNYDRGHRLYGIETWADMFTPRQLLTHGTFSEEFCNLIPEIHAQLGPRLGDAVLTVLALIQGKALNWNGRGSSWDVSRQKMRSVFEKHNFSFKWTFAEFEGAQALYPWCRERVTAAYEGISDLYDNTMTLGTAGRPLQRQVTVTQGNAADMSDLSDRSVAHLCMDPPYYDNVMYAELSDFFYVWEKRTLGKVISGFDDELTDKDNEAIANPARFASMPSRKKELADADYEAKMTAIFAECSRVLHDDGVLTVMFTHKRAEAWDVLGMGLLQAGFTIETSWPVNTEPEVSSHQAKKNAAASTIMLVCRKRFEQTTQDQVFFEDIEAKVRHEARSALERFLGAGLSGVDLLLSTYGPALSVISQHWPVYSSVAAEDGSSQLLRPEEALSAARAEVVRLQRSRLIGHRAHLDTLTDFTLIAWDTFRAAEFPYDDARRLALAVGGLDLAELERAKILTAKSGTVRLLAPKERLRKGEGALPGVRPAAEQFAAVIDAVHTVMYVAELDGLPVAKTMMDRLELTHDSSFLACVQGLVNAIPRAKVKGKWILPEAAILDRIVAAYLPEISVPEDEPEPAAPDTQAELFSGPTG